MGKKEKSTKTVKPVKAAPKAAPTPVKASKKTKPAPPPPSSSSSESDSDSSDEEPAKPVANGKTAPVKAAPAAAPPSDDSSSEDSSSSEDEKPKAKAVKPAQPPKAKAATSDSDSSSESDSDSDSDAPAPPKPVAAPAESSDSESSDSDDSDAAPKKTTTPAAKDSKSTTESSSDNSSDEDGDVAMKDGTDAAPATNGKRKAESDAVVPAKKARIVESANTSENAPSNTLWVGNLSWNVDDEWLKTEFESYGEVVSARVQMDRTSGRSRGFGYVELKELAHAQAAVADTSKEIDGRAPRVDFAPPRSAPDATKRAKTFNDTVSAPSSILFVGNLSFDATEDGCWESFGEFGEVMSVRLPTDRESGTRKGFGYVEYADQATAVKAFEGLQGKELFGRPIRLDYSHPRDNSGGGGGRGGDRGGRGGGRGGFRGGDRGFRGGGGRGGFGGDRGGRGGRGRGGPPRGRGAGAQAFEGKKITF